MTTMTKEQAFLELNLLEVETASTSSTDLYIWLQNSGLSPEIASKIHDLIGQTKKVAGQIVNVGKMIVIKIIEFLKENPNLAIGTAVGVVVGSILSAVPILGSLLAPIAVALGMIAGYRKDKREAGEPVAVDYKVFSVTEDLIGAAKLFLALLIDVFNALFEIPGQ